MMFEVKRLSLVCAVSSALVLGACAGRAGNPVDTRQYGDNEMSCDRIDLEIAMVGSEMQELFPKTDKTFRNSFFAGAGVVIPIAFLAMDVKNGDLVEYKALVKRYNYLIGLSADKKCGGKYPTAAELVADSEKAKKKADQEASDAMFQEDEFDN